MSNTRDIQSLELYVIDVDVYVKQMYKRILFSSLVLVAGRLIVEIIIQFEQ